MVRFAIRDEMQASLPASLAASNVLSVHQIDEAKFEAAVVYVAYFFPNFKLKILVDNYYITSIHIYYIYNVNVLFII